MLYGSKEQIGIITAPRFTAGKSVHTVALGKGCILRWTRSAIRVGADPNRCFHAYDDNICSDIIDIMAISSRLKG